MNNIEIKKEYECKDEVLRLKEDMTFYDEDNKTILTMNVIYNLIFDKYYQNGIKIGEATKIEFLQFSYQNHIELNNSSKALLSSKMIDFIKKKHGLLLND